MFFASVNNFRFSLTSSSMFSSPSSRNVSYQNFVLIFLKNLLLLLWKTSFLESSSDFLLHKLKNSYLLIVIEKSFFWTAASHAISAIIWWFLAVFSSGDIFATLSYVYQSNFSMEHGVNIIINLQGIPNRNSTTPQTSDGCVILPSFITTLTAWSFSMGPLFTMWD